MNEWYVILATHIIGCACNCDLDMIRLDFLELNIDQMVPNLCSIGREIQETKGKEEKKKELPHDQMKTLSKMKENVNVGMVSSCLFFDLTQLMK